MAESEFDQARQQAIRLYRMRVLFAAHTAMLICALLLTEGMLFTRYRVGLAVWLVLWMLHGVILALYEIREGEVRYVANQARLKRKRDARYGLTDDGELRPLDEDNAFDEAADSRQRLEKKGR
jgi:fatty acid desaturase